MSVAKGIRRLSAIARKPSLLKPNAKYIFLLSHMRSRSSLLSHILGSNDQIVGYSELHHSYTTKLSLVRMHTDIYQDLNCSFHNKYLFDKLLHNSRVLSDDVINYTNAKLIVLLREPLSTMKSIISMGDLVGNKKYTNQRLGFEYYCSRLQQLSGYAKNNFDVFFIDSDDLVTNPDYVLARLSAWLELNQALTQHYSIFKRTGVKRAGDPSKNIMEGKIIKTDQHKGIVLDEGLLAEAIEAHTLCKERFTM